MVWGEPWLEPPDDYLSEQDLDRLFDVAQERAADDPELGFPADGDLRLIELDGPETDSGDYVYTATYQGRTVRVVIDGDYLQPDDEPDYPYWED